MKMDTVEWGLALSIFGALVVTMCRIFIADTVPGWLERTVIIISVVAVVLISIGLYRLREQR